MSLCTPCPPCDTNFPLLCEPLETTANGKRLVVEDSAACQKTIQSPVAQQVLKTDGTGNLTWTNGASGTVLRKDSTGLVEFATLNSVLQSEPVNLGSQSLTTTGAVNSGAITATSVTATGAINGASVTATGAISGASAIITGSVGIGTTTPTTAMEISTSGNTELRITSSGNQNPTLSLNRASAASWQAVNDLGQLKIQSAGPGIDSAKTDKIFMDSGTGVSVFENVGLGTYNPASRLQVQGDITLTSSTTATTATAGTSGAIPAQVAGYLVVSINGTSRKIPYYAT